MPTNESQESWGTIGPNPFSNNSKTYKLWHKADSQAAEEDARFKALMLATQPDGPENYAERFRDWLIRMVSGRFEVQVKWSLRALDWSSESVKVWEELVRTVYMKLWQSLIRQNCPSFINRNDLIAQLKPNLLYIVEVYKADAIKRVREVEEKKSTYEGERLQADPDYQRTIREGQQAIDRAAEILRTVGQGQIVQLNGNFKEESTGHRTTLDEDANKLNSTYDIAGTSSNPEEEEDLSTSATGEKTAPAEPATDAIENLFAAEGEMFHIRFAGEEVGFFKSSVGMRFLAYLAAHPGQEIQTARQFEAVVYGEEIDRMMEQQSKVFPSGGFQKSSFALRDSRDDIQTALVSCREGLREIKRRRNELDMKHDPDPFERKQLDEQEREINRYINSLTRGKSNKAQLLPEVTKANKRIRQTVFQAIDRIRDASNGGALARHLDQNLKPFRFPLTYAPQPAIRWNE